MNILSLKLKNKLWTGTLNKFKKAKQLIWMSYAAMVVFIIAGWVIGQDVEVYCASLFLLVVLDSIVDCIKPEKTIDEQFRALK